MNDNLYKCMNYSMKKGRSVSPAWEQHYTRGVSIALAEIKVAAAGIHKTFFFAFC